MASPQQDYSTLEAAAPRHSTLEPYYPPASPHNGAKAYYAPEQTAFYNKEAHDSQHAASSPEPGPAAIATQEKRRYCGMTAKIALLVLAIVLLLIVGTIVGAVVGTRSKNNTTSPDPNSTSLPGDASTSDASPSTSRTRTPSSTTTSGTFTLPTTTSTCPAFVEDFRSDYWYTFGTRHPNRTDYDLWTVYLAGSYKHDSGKGTVRSTLVYNDTQMDSQFYWQFRRLDREPLGQLGCNDSVAVKKRLYKIACRLEDTKEDAGITLAMDEATRDSDKPRVALVKERDEDLSQLWYVDYRNETGWDWYEVKNYEGDWVLAAYTGDSEPWLERKGAVYTMFGRDMTRELIGEEWL